MKNKRNVPLKLDRQKIPKGIFVLFYFVFLKHSSQKTHSHISDAHFRSEKSAMQYNYFPKLNDSEIELKI